MTDKSEFEADERGLSESEKLTLGEFALASIQKHFHKSIKQEEEILKDHDPEPLHQMRVGMRRLRTALIVFAPFISLSVDLERDIAKISKSLGSVRDLDVLELWFRDFKAESTQDKEESKKVKKVSQQLDRRRQKQLKRMWATLKGNQYRQFVEEFQQWLKHPRFQLGAEWPIQLVLPDLLLPLINRLLLHPGWLAAIATPITPIEQWTPNLEITAVQVEAYLGEYGSMLHDLRKQTKRVRYQTEFFKDFYDSAYLEQTQEFRTIQDLLGKLQDSQVLGSFLDQEIGPHWQETMPSLKNYILQQRLELWRQWQPLQQKYLSPPFRDNLRTLVLRP
jgi:CHAD domain-containing protein